VIYIVGGKLTPQRSIKMKKIILSLVIFGSVLIPCFSNGSSEIKFDPTPTLFEGEWRNPAEQYSDQVFVFSGNSWKLICDDMSKSGSGYFTLDKNNNTISFYMENGRNWLSNQKYLVNSVMMKIVRGKENWIFFKQPMKEFYSDNELSSKLQGTWKYIYPEYDVTYTFSGNHFNFTYTNKKLNFEGSFETNEDGLIKFITSEGEAILHVTFKTDKSLWFEAFGNSIGIVGGDYIKK